MKQSNGNLTAIKHKGRMLSFPDRQITAVLPFGSGIDVRSCSFEIENNGGTPAIYARSTTLDSPRIQIFPPYQRRERVKAAKTGAPVTLQFWIVQTDLDRLRARQLIEREHYLMPTNRGLILACGVENNSLQAVRPARGRGPSLPPIIGVAVLDTLYHGNPKQGRALFATPTLGNDSWGNWSRDQIVSRFRIAWASRFAVDSRYQGLGIGTRLAKHLRVVARRHRLPAADFLEVITTESRTAPPDSETKGNFLIQAGFHRLAAPLRSAPLRRLNMETGYFDDIPAVKYYYYSDLRDVAQ